MKILVVTKIMSQTKHHMLIFQSPHMSTKEIKNRGKSPNIDELKWHGQIMENGTGIRYG